MMVAPDDAGKLGATTDAPAAQPRPGGGVPPRPGSCASISSRVGRAKDCFATFWAPFFPKYVLLLPADSVRGFFAVMAICALASLLAIHAALKVDPAEAIGG